MRLFFLCISLSLFAISCSDNRDAVLSNAQAALQAGDAHSAQSAYQSLLNNNQYDIDAIEGMAVCSLVMGATDDAAHWSRELLKYRPWDRAANLTAGKQAAEHGDFAEAANRLILAFIDSEFKLEKEEVRVEMLNLHRRIAAESIAKVTGND